MDECAQYIEQKGYIYSAFGRKRRLLNAKSSDLGLKSHDIRSGINFLIQSVASDANLIGAMDAQDEINATRMDAHIFALVHDSIVAEVREDQVSIFVEICLRNLQKDMGLSIPGCPIGVDYGVGDSYADA